MWKDAMRAREIKIKQKHLQETHAKHSASGILDSYFSGLYYEVAVSTGI